MRKRKKSQQVLILLRLLYQMKLSFAYHSTIFYLLFFGNYGEKACIIGEIIEICRMAVDASATHLMTEVNGTQNSGYFLYELGRSERLFLHAIALSCSI